MIAKPGTIDGAQIGPLAAADYHADRSAWGRSNLSLFLERRRKAEAWLNGTLPPQKATKEMDLGTACHAALLEPHRFNDLVCRWPTGLLSDDGGIRSKEAKAYRDEQIAAGKIVLKDAELSAALRMRDAVLAKCGEWLRTTENREQGCYWTDEESGLRCKCRPDIWLVADGDEAFIPDIKTTKDASPAAFRKRIEDGDFWLQDAHYRAGITAATGLPCQFLFVVVETDFPWSCVLYRLDEESLAEAQAVRRRLLNDVAGCIESGDWSEPWERDITPLPVRPWAFDVNQLQPVRR